jgi:hypothetical protein
MKNLKESLSVVFDNNFDCYTEITSTPAMTKETFIDLFNKFLPKNLTDIQEDILKSRINFQLPVESKIKF